VSKAFSVFVLMFIRLKRRTEVQMGRRAAISMPTIYVEID
jgi:hypothetical protein